MAWLFWILQALLGSVLLVPLAIVVVGGRVGFNEFAPWIIMIVAWIGGSSLIANLVRRAGRTGYGVLVLIMAIAPLVLLGYAIYEFGRGWRY